MLKHLFTLKDVCPTCKKVLTIDTVHFFSSHITKQCPDGHYERESHPALETPIEILKQ